MTRYKQIRKGYWHNELEKAQKALITIEDSNINSEIKEYICQLLKDEIARCKYGIKYVGD